MIQPSAFVHGQAKGKCNPDRQMVRSQTLPTAGSVANKSIFKTVFGQHIVQLSEVGCNKRRSEVFLDGCPESDQLSGRKRYASKVFTATRLWSCKNCRKKSRDSAMSVGALRTLYSLGKTPAPTCGKKLTSSEKSRALKSPSMMGM
eukprot:6420585-Amphidinium_carterae.2